MPRPTRGSKAGIARFLRQVIQMEARTLQDVRRAVNGDYEKAVRMMAACKGKVVVTGTGKSGLIGQKISATLASTGTPSLYMHPADGVHGSLGIIQSHDLVLAIGKSGESDELNGMLPALRRMKVPIIAMTSSKTSTLARMATVTVHVPVEAEACPLNLAPTCSTTASLAVGDALAVALMRLRGFKEENFALLHPAGQLGKRLTLRVADIMKGGKDNPAVRLTATIGQMLVEMTRKQTGAVSVVDARGRLVGLVTDYDVRSILKEGGDIKSKSIAEIMNRRPTCARPEDKVVDALKTMLDRKKPFALLPVVDGKNRSVGMLHLHDIRKMGL